jgi:hypothetical protein
VETVKKTLVVPENHQLHFDVSLPRAFPTGLADVILTFSPQNKAAPIKGAAVFKLAGVLKNSPNFSGDPVAIQKAMRDEWQR